MELYKTVEEVNNAIKDLEIHNELINKYVSALKNNQLLKDNGYDLEPIDMDYIITRINIDLQKIGDPRFKQISSINELNDLLSQLQNEYVSTDFLRDNIDKVNNWNINDIQTRLNYLNGILTKINYYSGINNCYTLLDSVLKRANNNGIISLDSNSGLINELDDFRIRLSDHVTSKVDDKISRVITNITLSGKTYTAKTEEMIINDLKDAVKTILDKKVQTQMGIEIMALENRHRNNMIALRKINFMPDFDMSTKPLNIKSLINIIKDKSDKEALETLSQKYNWYNRNDLTIYEIMNVISVECKNNEKYIGTNYKVKVESQIKICSEQINALKNNAFEKEKEYLSIKSENIYNAIRLVNRYLNLFNSNKDKVRSTKTEMDEITLKLGVYDNLLKDNLKAEIQEEISKLDALIDDPIKFKEIVLSNKKRDKRDSERSVAEIYQKIPEKEKFKIFGKYYLNQAINIYLKAIRAFYNLSMNISNAINNYSYDSKGKKYASQLSNDIDDFIDMLKPNIVKRANQIFSSDKKAKEIIKVESPEKKKTLGIQNLNIRFSLKNNLPKLKLYRVHMAKEILDKVTNRHFGMSDLGEYARSEAQLMQDAEVMSDYLNSTHDDVAELIGVNPTRK